MRSRLQFLLLVATVSFLCVIILGGAKAAHASGWEWSNATTTVFQSTKITDTPNTSYCPTAYQTKMIAGVARPTSVCMQSGSTTRFGTYRSEDGFITVVGTKNDSKMYRFAFGACSWYDSCLYIPETDTLATKQYIINGQLRSLVLYKNFSKRLVRPGESSQTYYFNSSNPDFTYQSDEGYAWPIGGFGASENGQWLAVEQYERGILLVNVDTLTTRKVSGLSYSYSSGFNPRTELAVSDDGQHIAVMGVNAWVQLIKVRPECGEERSQHSCEIVYFTTDYFIDRLYYGAHPRLNNDGAELSFFAYSYNGEQREVILHAGGYEAQRIDYLALGDSFSSGEGETDDSYYLPGTNELYEKCHVSKRSYPFLIAQSLGIESQYVRSVACSGAKVEDVVGDDAGYLGQGDRILSEGLADDKSKRTLAKSYARDNFVPGLSRQETFLRRYHPKAVTIGIGGNDAGFMQKLRTCIGPGTCEWAGTAEGREKVALEVRSLFNTFADTYSALHDASPQTKIYVIGYPKIIDPTGECDSLNASLFDDSERQFMDQGIVYINKVIEAAAEKAGVTYIDISDSFGDSMLCGAQIPSMMNSVVLGDDSPKLEGFDWIKFIGQESFHPRPSGQIATSRAILAKIPNILDYDYCQATFGQSNRTCPVNNAQPPGPSSYWLEGDKTHAYSATHLASFADESVAPGGTTAIDLPDQSFGPDENVHIEIHSEPNILGDFPTTAQGGLQASVIIPSDLAIGFHTIHIFGNSFSGEPIDLYQIVRVSPPVEEDRGNPDASVSTQGTSAPIAQANTGSLTQSEPSGAVDNEQAVAGVSDSKPVTEIVSGPASDSSTSQQPYWIMVAVMALLGIVSYVVIRRRHNEG